jgi:tetratricopeptide (TPR) repeat protein
MFTDIAGYTALMGEDERRARHALERGRELLGRLIAKFNGTLIEHVGDGSLSSFGSAVEAVTCAHEIQKSLRDDADLRLRIGIHIGDVVVSDGKIIGDGVNIASRIHALAEPGGVCISEKVYDDIRNHPEMRATYLGQKQLKNVNRPIRVYALAAEGGLAAEPGGKSTRRAWLLAAAIALLVVIAGYPMISRYTGGQKSPERVPPSSPTAVAVLPFSVSGGKDLSYLSEGMVTLLSMKLDGAEELRQVDPHSLLSFVKREGAWTADPEHGQRVAEHFGAGLYVLGSVLELSGRLQLEASIYQADRALVVTKASAEGETSHLLDLVDQLATELLVGRLTKPGERLARIAASTSHSFPAVKSFLEGESAFRAGRFPEAIEAYRRAVAADPDFALAYYRLSYVAGGLTQQAEESRNALAQAMRVKGRLSEHDRLRLEQAWDWANGRVDAAERRARDMLATYPDDWETWLALLWTLGENPFRGRSVTEVRDPLERALSLDTARFDAVLYQTQLDEAEENWTGLSSSIEHYLALDSQSDWALVLQTQQAFQFGDKAKQDRIVAELRNASDYAVGGVPLVQMLHNAPASEALARQLTEPVRSSTVRSIGHVQLAHLALKRGRWNAAQTELDAAAKLDPSMALEYRALLAAAPFVSLPRPELEKLRDELIRWRPPAASAKEASGDWFSPHDDIHPQLRLYLIGLLSIRLADREAAARDAAELERPIESPKVSAVARAFAGSLRAQVAQLDDKPEEALAILEQTRLEIAWEAPFRSAFFSRGYERYLRAELLHAVGRDQDALPWYTSLEESMLYDRVYLAPSHLRRAEIYEKLGDREKAIFHYSRFLALWADCDEPLRPLLAEAKERLERLKGAAA